MSKIKLDNGKVIGTNCYNCKFIADKEIAVDPKELNDDKAALTQATRKKWKEPKKLT